MLRVIHGTHSITLSIEPMTVRVIPLTTHLFTGAHRLFITKFKGK